MSDIFICYAKEDRTSAQRLCDDLRAEGFDVWIDFENLLPGTPSWKDKIREIMHGVKFIIVLLSQISVSKRGFVQAEIREAIEISKEVPETDIFLIPARLEECSPPWNLTPIQWVDLFPLYGTGLSKIVSALRSHGGDDFAVPISAVARPRALDHPRPVRKTIGVINFIVWYAQVLINLTLKPKTFIRTRNFPTRANLIASVEFMVISSVPYSMFNALLPLDAKDLIYHVIGYTFVTLFLVFSSSFALRLAWHLLGGGAPWLQYAITNAYYSGTAFFLGFINVMLAVGLLKFFDKRSLLLLRRAAAGDIGSLIGAHLLASDAVIAALWVLALGHILLLFWTFVFWGSYREFNSASRKASFYAWLLSSIFVLPIGLVAALLQQALFNFVD